MSERSEFGFLYLLLADFCKLRVPVSETRKRKRTSFQSVPSTKEYLPRKSTYPQTIPPKKFTPRGLKTMQTLPTPLIITYLTLLGTTIASFLTCLTSRRQSGESILTGRSHCQTCGHPLHPTDLIPIISYLTHKGRCRYCHAQIPFTCLTAELWGAILYPAIFLHFGWSCNTLMWLIAGTLLLSLSLIDAQEQIIPNPILLLLALNRLIFLPLSDTPIRQELTSILTGTLIIPTVMLFLTLLMDKLMKRETMGGGDLKLLYVLGLYLNWKNMFFMLFISCLLGLIWIAVRKTFNKQADPTIAFGPFLSIGCLAAVWFADPFITWYIHLF